MLDYVFGLLFVIVIVCCGITITELTIRTIIKDIKDVFNNL